MTWRIELDDRAVKELRKLDRPVQRQILRFLRDRVATPEDPRRFGRALSGERIGLWRYRVGAYRLLCRIEDDRLVVLMIAVGHRREIFR